MNELIVDKLIARQSIELRPFPNDPSVGLCIRQYKFGFAIETEGLTPDLNRLEFFVNNGVGQSDGAGNHMAAILTLSAGREANFVELRFPGDANCLNFRCDKSGVFVTTEKPHTSIEIAPNGKLLVHGEIISEKKK